MRSQELGGRPLTRWRPLAGIIARSWWAIVLGGLVGAVAGAVQAGRVPPVWEADAVVMATSTSLPAAQFGELSRSFFATDAVIQPVIQALGTNLSPRSLFAEGFLRVVDVPGTTTFRVVGRAQAPQLAAGLANRSASSFAAVAAKKRIGQFVVFPGGTVRRTTSRTLHAAWGAEIGVLVGALLAFLVAAVRRPVYDEGDIRRFVSPDVVFPASVTGKAPWGGGRRAGVYPRGLAPAIWRAAAARTSSGGRPGLVAIDAGSRRSKAVGALVAQISRGPGDESVGPVSWVNVRKADADPAADALEDAGAIVAVIGAGTSERKLERIREALQPVPSDTARFLVLVR